MNHDNSIQFDQMLGELSIPEMLDVTHVNKYVNICQGLHMVVIHNKQESKGPSPKVERKYRLEPWTRGKWRW